MERILPDYPDVDARRWPARIARWRRAAADQGHRGVRKHRDEPWIDRVTMLGVIDDETLHREYARADVVVLPSRYESFGLVMVEAMMHGKPLVSTDTSGVREVVRNGVDGLLVAPGDVDSWSSAIRRLLDDPAVRGERSAEAARERFVVVPLVDPARRALRASSARDLETRRPVSPTTASSDRALAAGEASTIDLAGRAAADRDRPGGRSRRVVRIVDGGERTLDLRPGERQRIRLDVASGK